METVVKKYFICETCGKTSQQEERIEECQGKHRFISGDCKIEHKFAKGGEFPKELYITFGDGSVAQYICNWSRAAKPVVEEPPKEETA